MELIQRSVKPTDRISEPSGKPAAILTLVEGRTSILKTPSCRFVEAPVREDGTSGSGHLELLTLQVLVSQIRALLVPGNKPF